MVFAQLVSEVVEEFRAKGINKPVVASLVGDVEVEEASRYLFDHDIPAYAYTTEKPVAVLGAKYRVGAPCRPVVKAGAFRPDADGSNTGPKRAKLD